MMSWLNRYIAAVKSYLPTRQRDDVGDELQSLLQERFEAEAEALGRDLTDEEHIQLLSELDHPMRAAAAYQSRKTLISEALFPLYKQVLKWVFLALLVANIVIATLNALPLAEWPLTQLLNQFFAQLGHMFVYAFAYVTLLFYALDSVLRRKAFFSQWDPRSLPPLTRDNNVIPLHETIPAIIATLVFLAIINQVQTIEIPLFNSGYFLQFHHTLLSLVLWVNVLLVATLSLHCLHLFTPYWTQFKLGCNIALSIAAIMLFIALFRMEPIVLAIPYAVADQADAIAQINRYTQNWLRFILTVASLFQLYYIWRDGKRIYKGIY